MFYENKEELIELLKKVCYTPVIFTIKSNYDWRAIILLHEGNNYTSEIIHIKEWAFINTFDPLIINDNNSFNDINKNIENRGKVNVLPLMPDDYDGKILQTLLKEKAYNKVIPPHLLYGCVNSCLSNSELIDLSIKNYKKMERIKQNMTENPMAAIQNIFQNMLGTFPNS